VSPILRALTARSGKRSRIVCSVAKTEFERPFQEAGNELSAGETESKKGKGYTWVGPKPLSGPTPEDSMRDLEGIEQSVEDEAS